MHARHRSILLKCSTYRLCLQITPAVAYAATSVTAPYNATARELQALDWAVSYIEVGGRDIMQVTIPFRPYRDPLVKPGEIVVSPADTFVYVDWGGLLNCTEGWRLADNCTAAACHYFCQAKWGKRVQRTWSITLQDGLSQNATAARITVSHSMNSIPIGALRHCP